MNPALEALMRLLQENPDLTIEELMSRFEGVQGGTGGMDSPSPFPSHDAIFNSLGDLPFDRLNNLERLRGVRNDEIAELEKTYPSLSSEDIRQKYSGSNPMSEGELGLSSKGEILTPDDSKLPDLENLFKRPLSGSELSFYDPKSESSPLPPLEGVGIPDLATDPYAPSGDLFTDKLVKDAERVLAKNSEPLPTSDPTSETTNSERRQGMTALELQMMLMGGQSIESKLFRAGQSLRFKPNTTDPKLARRGKRANIFRGIGAAGSAGLGIARNVAAGAGFQNRMNFFMDEFNKKRGEENYRLFGKGGEFKKLTTEMALTGEYITGVPKAMENPEKTVEVEAGEYTKSTDDNEVQRVVGNKHTKGGEKLLKREAPTQVLSDQTKIGGVLAQQLKKDYGVKVSAKTTFADVLDKYTKKIGLREKNEEHEELFKMLRKSQKVKHKNTSKLNEAWLAKEIKKLEDAKKPLKEQRTQLFDYLYGVQQERKTESEVNQTFAKGGSFSAKRRLMKEYGLTEMDVKALMAEEALRKKYATGGEIGGGDDDYITKILQFERAKGSSTGTGLSNFGFNTGVPPKNLAEARVRFEAEILPQVASFPSELQPILADYVFNTGRSPEDLLLYASGEIGLKDVNSAKTHTAEWDKNKAKVLNKLKGSKGVELINSKKENVYKTTGGYTLDNPNPSYEATWKPRLKIFAPSPKSPPLTQFEENVNAFRDPSTHVNQRFTSIDPNFTSSGLVTPETINDRIQETLRIFPEAAQFMDIDFDESSGAIKTAKFKDKKSVGDFQEYVQDVYSNIQAFAGEEFKDNPEQAKAMTDFVEGLKFEKGVVSKEFDSFFGNFTSSRSGLKLRLVNEDELKELNSKGVTSFTQLYKDGKFRTDLDLTPETKKKLEGIRDTYGERFEVGFLPIPREPKTIERKPSNPVSEFVPKPTPEKPLETDDEFMPTEEPITDEFGNFLFFPDQSIMPPEGIQPHLLAKTRLERLDPVKISPNRQLEEIFRQQDAVTKKVEGMPDPQQKAVLSNMLANTQSTAAQVIGQTNQANAQNFQQTEQFNIGQSSMEEQARVNNLLNYEQRQLTAKAKTQEQYMRYFDHNKNQKLSNFKQLQQINTLNKLYENFNVDGFGAPRLDENGNITFDIPTVGTGTEKKKTTK